MTVYPLLNQEALMRYALQGLDRQPFTDEDRTLLTKQFGPLQDIQLLRKWAVWYFLVKQVALKPIFSEQSPQPAAAESKPYCHAKSSKILQACIFSDYAAELVEELLCVLIAQNQIVLPYFLPSLMVLFEDRSYKSQGLLLQAGGERLLWALQHQPTDFKLFDYDNDNHWLNANLKERILRLAEWRKNKPREAAEWLQNQFPFCSANEQAQMLEVFAHNLSENDLAFLKELTEIQAKKLTKNVLMAALKLRAAIDKDLQNELTDILRQNWQTGSGKKFTDLKEANSTEWPLGLHFLKAMNQPDLLYFFAATCPVSAWFALTDSQTWAELLKKLGYQPVVAEIARGLLEGIWLRQEKHYIQEALPIFFDTQHIKKIALSCLLDLLPSENWLEVLKTYTTTYEWERKDAQHPIVQILKARRYPFFGEEQTCLVLFFQRIITERKYLVYEWSEHLKYLTLKLNPQEAEPALNEWLLLAQTYPHWQTPIYDALKLLKLRKAFL